MMRPLLAAAFVFALAVSLCADDSPSPKSPAPSPSLHERIDQLIEIAAVGPLAPLCGDADFVRRVYLDLIGVIPTADKARAFVADKNADKRQRLIDELLASPDFVRHITITLDVMLMERKPEKVVKQPEWEAYLYKSLAADKPLDRLFRELVAADGADEAQRPAAKFTLDRDAEPNLVTRDIGRLVFGMDLQCCQCHDHPLIDDYYQDDYYGLYAFVHRTSLFTDAKTKQILLTEKADGEASFKSVFTGASSDKAQPRLPKGAVLFVEPTFAKGEEYNVKPDKTVRGVPKFSRREALAEMIPTSREFSRNLANRLWAHLLGRGIVHPVDFHYAANPPSNPQLLTLLADELAASGYKLRPLLREMTLSRTYQRSCDAPRPETINVADIAARLAKLSADKQAQQQSVQPLKDAIAAAKAQFKAARDEEARIAGQIVKLQAAIADARQALGKATAERTAADGAIAKIRQQSEAVALAMAQLTSAASQLSDNTTLAEASSKVAAVTEELKAALAAAETALAERRTAEQAATMNVAKAEATLALQTAARPTVDRLRELEQAQLNAEHRFSDANYARAQIDTQMATCQAILDHAALAKTDPVKADAAWQTVVERWTIAGQITALKPLAPEQFATSGMQAASMLAGQLAAAEAKLDKTPPDELKKATDADKPRLRQTLSQLELLNQLRGTFGEFVRQYGGQPGQEFQATVNQALFFGNGTVIESWLKPAGENLVARLAKLDDASAIADELAWSVFSRPATDGERQAAATYLKDRSDKPVAISEMAWALLSSSEFRFNH